MSKGQRGVVYSRVDAVRDLLTQALDLAESGTSNGSGDVCHE